MRRLLLAFCVLQLQCVGGQRCPVEIWVFENASQCESEFQNPSAVGLLYADSSCRTTYVLSSNGTTAEAQLPGTYSLQCVYGTEQKVEFTDSGCIWSNCYTSFTGVCAHYADNPGSLYAVGQTPATYNVYDSDSKYASENHTCTTLTSGQGQSLTFILFGNCSDPACEPFTLHPKPSPPPSYQTSSSPDATSAPTSISTSILVPTTRPRPTIRPSTFVPANGSATTLSPTVEVTPTSTSTESHNGTIPAPVSSSSTPAPSQASQNVAEHSAAGVIASSSVAGAMLVAVVLSVAILLRSRYKWRQALCIAAAGKEDAHEKQNRRTSGKTGSQIIREPYVMDDLRPSQSCRCSIAGCDEHFEMPVPCITIDSDIEGNGAHSSLGWESDVPSSHSLASNDSTLAERIVGAENLCGSHFRIMVPPGELGVDFDTSRGGPEVYSMETSSVLLGQIRMGDQLLAIDGIDIHDASRAELMHLINLRSEASRCLTFYRPPKTDGGAEGELEVQ